MARVLIVDDSWLTRRALAKILAADGHEFAEATNGLEAAVKLAEFHPDVILLDLVMPEMDGFEFLRSYQSRAERVPVLVLTADIQDTTHAKCADLGVAGVLHKPPREHEINEQLARILKGDDNA